MASWGDEAEVVSIDDEDEFPTLGINVMLEADWKRVGYPPSASATHDKELFKVTEDVLEDEDEFPSLGA